MTVRHSVSIFALLLTAGLAFGQGAPKKDATPKEPPKPAPGSLEDTLEKALRNSADIKAAEAKVRDAEAELHKVRHQVLTKATALHTDLNLAKRMLALAEDSARRLATAAMTGGVDQQSLHAAQTVVEKHRGEVQKLETELKSLRGQFAVRSHAGAVRSVAFDPDGRIVAGEGADGTVRVWDVATGRLLTDLMGKIELTAPAAAVKGSMAERVRKLLDQEIQFKAVHLPLETALRNLLAEAKSDIPLRATLLSDNAETPVELPAGKLPVGAWIQVIEDTDPKVVIVVRDYGLLLTMKDRIPDGALRVQDLWKGNYTQLRKDEPKGGEKK